ncbi:type I restriction-modification system subunit M [Candidatus Uabimicrobium amorphum]|uniref:site-specific DNA-methyltransferase (adenine-specific) n=1 Tax=Uabimicrobium amorphum TaxID=2596890 RepID=A0A5S9IKE9_UABAM|nr:class I SAM-dependent DNA methyltransferase [Candidatus Uabimicrobium amorphum]BBM83334.1 type I restriction-modification system subunit M [Candidatus Uabimicrobium amorphum]
MTEQKTNEEKINSILWETCSIFREYLNPEEYKNYIITFFFFKYICDVWKDKKKQYEEQFKNDKHCIKKYLEKEKLIIPTDYNYDFIYQKRDSNSIGKIINKVLFEIENRNKVLLDGVFCYLDFNSKKIRNDTLKNLIENFANLDLRPSQIDAEDTIGNVYRSFITRFVSAVGKKGGAFYTPREVSSLLAKLVIPEPGNRICDPACGTASLLLQVANEIEEEVSLYGQEINLNTCALAKMNVYLHGKNALIEQGHTLENPKFIENDNLMKFDIVVSNPPFSIKDWGFEKIKKDKFKRFHRGMPPKSTGDYAFITHIVETITEKNGRAAVLVPHGVLFRGAAEKEIRKKLITENLLSAVIGLPSNLLYGIGIPTAILVITKGKLDSNILFIDASQHYESKKSQHSLRPKDIKKIYWHFIERKTVERYSYLAKFEEIEENEFNLNIRRYVETFQEEKINTKEVQFQIQQIEEELTKTRNQIKTKLDELGKMQKY